MNPRSFLRRFLSQPARGRWESLSLGAAFALFVIVLAALVPIWSGRDSAASLPVNIHAKVTADYSIDPLGTSHPAIGLGIIEAVLLDDNPFASDADDRLATLTVEMLREVPTSTRADATGVPPPTSLSPTSSPLPSTPTTAPTSTNTPTARATVTSNTTPIPATGIVESAVPSTATITRTATLQPGLTVTPSITLTQSQAICVNYPTTGFVAIQDAWIDADRPNSNNESSPKLELEPGAKEKDALIQFDVSSIPEGSTVQAATLYLNVTKTSTYTVEFREIFTEWMDEVTWQTQPDFDLSFVSGELELRADQGGNCVRSVDLDTDLVEYWIDNPDYNYGLFLVAADVGEKAEISSLESNRPPRLIIDTE